MSGRSEFVVIDASVPLSRSERLERAASLLDTLTLWLLIGLLVLAPMALGAVEPWGQFMIEAAAALCLSLWAVRQALAPEFRWVGSRLFAPALALAAIVALQMLLGRSAYAYATREKALLYLAYAAILLLATQVLSDERGARRFAAVVACFGAATALFAVIQDVTSNGAVYWIIQPQTPSLIFGPYVNRNHYAGLMEMLTAIPLVVAMLCPLTVGKRMFLTSAALLMGSTIFLSLSRGGMVAFAAELLLFGAYCLRFRSTRRAAIPLVVACVLMLAFVSWVGANQLFRRVSNLNEGTGLNTDTRVMIVRDSVQLVKDRPLLGWGLGTFTTVYPAYRSFYSAKTINAAHNDYAQAAVETGLLGLAVVAWFLVALFWEIPRGHRPSATRVVDAVRVGALLGCAGLLVHGLVDFNFQIPANAALFCALAGIGAARVPDSGPGYAMEEPSLIDRLLA